MESLAPSREKYWEEKDDHEKILKLGEAITNLAQTLKKHDELIEKLLIHGHDSFGLLTQRMIQKEETYIPYWLKNPIGREKY